MPADIKSAPPARATSLMGSVFTFQSEAERVEGIDKAFDYRGDVTLTLTNGQSLEGFMSNREAKASPPRVQFYIKGQEQPMVIPYSDITAISFSGKDPADGKSWDAWVSKKEHERKAEADRIKAESEAQGHL